MPTGEKILVDDEDFDRVNQHSWWRLKKPSGLVYAQTEITTNGRRRSVRLARFVMRIRSRKKEVDHRNGDGLDNRKENLRVLVLGKNRFGFCRKRKGATSRYRGVSWNRAHKKWWAAVEKHGRYHFLGLHDDEKQAALAYNKKAIALGFLPEALNKVA